jgi:hypothetical protein
LGNRPGGLGADHEPVFLFTGFYFEIDGGLKAISCGLAPLGLDPAANFKILGCYEKNLVLKTRS